MTISNAARSKAKEILRDLHIDRPELLSHLEEICIERGAYVRVKPLDDAEARLTVRGSNGIITVKPENRYVTRTRFSIAHELGHFELHRKDGAVEACDQNDLNDWFAEKSREREANEFASELLMPEEFLKPEIDVNEPSFAFLERISERYQTSLFATTKRFIDLTDRACAAVFFRGEDITGAWKSKGFASLKYWISGKLNRYSYAYDAAKGIATPESMSVVEAVSWFKVPAWLGEETLLEQTRYFPNLGCGMSLLWIPSGELLQPFRKNQ